MLRKAIQMCRKQGIDREGLMINEHGNVFFWQDRHVDTPKFWFVAASADGLTTRPRQWGININTSQIACPRRAL